MPAKLFLSQYKSLQIKEIFGRINVEEVLRRYYFLSVTLLHVSNLDVASFVSRFELSRLYLLNS